jgi:membrane associated rhomboid family serine protease
MFRVTPVVRNLIIANIVVFVLQQIVPIASDACLEFQYNPGLTGLIALWKIGSCAFRPYQFFTYMFAHGGLWHILFNMLALASFGPILETYWGDKKFLLFYIATGIGAGVIYSLVDFFIFPGGGGSMLGASGAIYGILMAFGLLFPNLEVMMIFPPIPVKAKYMVFIIGFLTYIMDRSGTVAHVAHFGGAFIAFIIIRFVWGNKTDGRY